ncbi:MAG: hypothetical protein ABWY54_05860 [Glaciihabitans sp.]
MTTLPSPHRSVDLVLQWCSFYTRRIDAAAADQRRNEIRSDLHEHVVWAMSAGKSASEIDRSVVSRAIRGAVHDLSWRRAQRRREALADPVFTRGRRADLSVTSLLSVYAVLLVAWGLYVCARVAQSVALGYIRPWSATSVTLLVATGLAACGFALVLRSRTRPLGALWLALPTVILVYSGLYQLHSISATVSWFTFSLSGWSLAVTILVMGALILLAAAAIWTWPTDTTENRQRPVAASTERNDS